MPRWPEASPPSHHRSPQPLHRRRQPAPCLRRILSTALMSWATAAPARPPRVTAGRPTQLRAAGAAQLHLHHPPLLDAAGVNDRRTESAWPDLATGTQIQTLASGASSPRRPHQLRVPIAEPCRPPPKSTPTRNTAHDLETTPPPKPTSFCSPAPARKEGGEGGCGGERWSHPCLPKRRHGDPGKSKRRPYY